MSVDFLAQLFLPRLNALAGYNIHAVDPLLKKQNITVYHYDVQVTSHKNKLRNLWIYIPFEEGSNQ
jgi:hypothetical protein